MSSSVLSPLGSPRSVRLPTRTTSSPVPVVMVVGPAIDITLTVSAPPWPMSTFVTAGTAAVPCVLWIVIVLPVVGSPRWTSSCSSPE